MSVLAGKCSNVNTHAQITLDTMNKVHVVHIAQSLGGVETAVRNIVENIDDTRFASSVMTIRNLDIYSKSGNKVPCYEVPMSRGIRPLRDSRSYLAVLRTARKLKPDVIHCHSSKGGYLGRLTGRQLGIPVAFTPHCFAFQSTDKPVAKTVYTVLERLVKPCTTRIIACSDSEAELARKGLGFDANRVVVWKNCLPTRCFKFERQKIYDFPYICSIGRPCYQKNLELTIRMMAKIKEQGVSVKLVQLGAGHYSPLRAKVEEMIRDYDLEEQVVLKEWSSHEKTLNILSQAELFVLSSRYEGLPYSVIEAFALGKAVVATDVSGTRDIVRNNVNGFLTQPDDAEGMAEKVLLLLRDESLRSRVESAARQSYLGEYNTLKCIRHLEDIYTNLAKAEESQSESPRELHQCSEASEYVRE